jgi:hypothetical protein
MKKSKNVLVITAAGVCCLVVVWLSTSIQGSQKTYELRPQISVPEYRTDAARAIDAYERLMDRYVDLTERNLFRVAGDMQGLAQRLDSIDDKLAELCARIADIEKALGVEQPGPGPQPEAVGKMSDDTSPRPTVTD